MTIPLQVLCVTHPDACSQGDIIRGGTSFICCVLTLDLFFMLPSSLNSYSNISFPDPTPQTWVELSFPSLKWSEIRNYFHKHCFYFSHYCDRQWIWFLVSWYCSLLFKRFGKKSNTYHYCFFLQLLVLLLQQSVLLRSSFHFHNPQIGQSGTRTLPAWNTNFELDFIYFTQHTSNN